MEKPQVPQKPVAPPVDKAAGEMVQATPILPIIGQDTAHADSVRQRVDNAGNALLIARTFTHDMRPILHWLKFGEGEEKAQCNLFIRFDPQSPKGYVLHDTAAGTPPKGSLSNRYFDLFVDELDDKTSIFSAQDLRTWQQVGVAFTEVDDKFHQGLERLGLADANTAPKLSDGIDEPGKLEGAQSLLEGLVRDLKPLAPQFRAVKTIISSAVGRCPHLDSESVSAMYAEAVTMVMDCGVETVELGLPKALNGVQVKKTMADVDVNDVMTRVEYLGLTRAATKDVIPAEGDFDNLTINTPRTRSTLISGSKGYGVGRTIPLFLTTEFGQVPPVLGNAPDLKAALDNVVRNSVKSCVEMCDQKEDVSGWLPHVKATTGYDKQQNEVVITISDTGRGVAPQDMLKQGETVESAGLNDPVTFHQRLQEFVYTPGSTTQKAGEGHGMGGSSAREKVVDEHGGKIEFFTDGLYKGSKTVIRIPARQHMPQDGS